jgi:hypothetical protein
MTVTTAYTDNSVRYFEKNAFLRKKTLYLVVKNQLLEGGQVAVLSIG